MSNDHVAGSYPRSGYFSGRVRNPRVIRQGVIIKTGILTMITKFESVRVVK
jgi:hypothetical protein